MKFISVFTLCFLLIHCASTNQSNENKPYVEATEREYSFDHIDDLPNNLEELVSSPQFRTPSIKGGQEALQKEVSKLTKRTSCPVRGSVSVAYVVDKEGRVIDPQTVLGIHESCDSIAEIAISNMSFEPAMFNGKPIKLRMSNAISFE